MAAGTLAKLLLSHLGISIVSHIVALGEAAAGPDSPRPGPADLERVDASAVRSFDPDAEEAMIAAVKEAAKVGDSLGGVAEVLAYGVPVGLGSHVHWDRKLDANLAQALMSIQAVKAVEIGDGWDNAAAGAQRPTTPSSTTRNWVTYGRPNGPGGSRAASPTARLLWRVWR